MIAEPWVSIDEMATHLRVAQDSVYRWIERKGLPAREVGRLWNLEISEVEEWVREAGVARDNEHGEEERG